MHVAGCMLQVGKFDLLSVYSISGLMNKTGLHRRIRNAGIALLVLFFLSLIRDAGAQFYNGSQMTFGKNRIQYKEFLWTYYKFKDFDTYFYLNGRELAIKAAKYATLQIPKLERRLEIPLNDKIQFVVFNNLSDLKQSNIGLIGNQQYNTGGMTHIIGKKVFLYFDGDQRNFEKQIRSGIANVLLNQILYGSSIGSQVKNQTLFTLPDWYQNGLLSYIAEDWSTELDNYVKDGVLSGRYEKFNRLTGDDAMYAGHSLWKYVAERYGKMSISAIINMTHLSRSVENGLLYAVGVSFNVLIEEWLAYYQDRYSEDEQDRDVPGVHLLKKVKKRYVYSQASLSPDGRYVAYTTNESGKYKIYLLDLVTGKKKKLFRGGYRLEEKVDYSYPLLTWHPSGRILSFIVERKGEVYLYFYAPEDKKRQSVILFNFEKIADLAYSEDGRFMVFSAIQKGQSDIYIYNIAAGAHRQITNDTYDDLNPIFVNNSKGIVFASNRLSDTLNWDPDEITAEVPFSTDLFLYDNETKSRVLRRVTNTPLANEIEPLQNENGYISFLSDENGIYNRYIGRFDSTISFIDTAVHYRYFTEKFPVTNYSRNIIHHDISILSEKYAEVIFTDGVYKMFINDLIPPEEETPLQLTFTNYREEYARVIDEIKMEKIKAEAKKASKKYAKGFRNVFRDSKEPAEQTKGEGKIDINNYQFDDQTIVATGIDGKDTVSSPKHRQGLKDEKKDEFEIPKRLNYRVEYSINQLTTQLDFTSLNYFYQPYGGGVAGGFYNLGLNGFFKVGITDLLEDHRMVGGFRIPLSLNNIEYIFSYANLKKRIDKEVVFVRQASETRYNYGYYTFINRLRSYQLYYILTYPLSPVLALRGTVNIRYQRQTWLSTNEIGLREPGINDYWGGLKGEVIYDDTKELGLNLYVGTRLKVFGEYTQILGENDINMSVVGFDIRNYQRIHRVFIWANRIAASTSFGKNHLLYYMGGVDNWLFPKFSASTPLDPEMSYAYQTLATSMRGFNQNARNGNNFVLLSSELRFPVFRYFYNRPVKSDFLNNFQIVAFGDVGTAWAGTDPYADENSLYTKVIRDGSLYIIVHEQKEPLIGGFGFGARTRLFGYFLRGDLAWGVEDRVIKKPIFYFSMSLDF